MSRTPRSYARWLLVVPSLVLIGLAASATTAPTAQAQSPSPTPALLNRMSAPTYRVLAVGNPSPTAISGAISGAMSGRGSDVESVYYAAFTGVGAEGRYMVWRGAVAGATVGALTLRLAREGQDTDTVQPEWPVEGTISVAGEDPQRAFTATVRGTIHWPTKRLRLVGDVSVGSLRGARVEQTGQLNLYDLAGELRVTPASAASELTHRGAM